MVILDRMLYTHERGGMRDNKHMLDVAVLSIKYKNCNGMHDFLTAVSLTTAEVF